MNTKHWLIAALGLFLVSATGLMAQDRWVKGSNGKVNGFTLYGGNENGQNLFLCAGYMNGTYHPGKIVGTNCNFGYGGREITANEYFTLQVSHASLQRYSWRAAANGQVPRLNGYVPIEVGREGNRILYVCRASYNGGVHPGKIVGSNCNFGWGGNEITIPNYEVLMFRTN